MMYWDGHAGHMSGAGWFAMILVLLLLVALVVAAVYAFIRIKRAGDPGTTTRTSARRLLDERFARGEIDPDDYRVRRELLDRETLR
jgi:putative membrane protein